MNEITAQLIEAAKELRDAVKKLRFPEPVTFTYNPLEYAWPAHELYLRTYGDSPKKVIFLGMNPGPFGMAQTGVPFGEVTAVKAWLKIQAQVGRPPAEHPKRPVQGFGCPRSEPSGHRLWGRFARRVGDARSFFATHFVANYCPLIFMEASGANFAPSRLSAAQLAPLDKICDWHLREVIRILQPEWVIGVGKFAEERAQRAAPDRLIKKGHILHPSPASPAANRDWAGTAERQLLALGVWK